MTEPTDETPQDPGPAPAGPLAFAKYVWRRFIDDDGPGMAASLSYTSLLAIVPLTAIAFAMLAGYPAFAGMREQFYDALFANFLPDSAQATREYFDQFVVNTGQLTAVGIVGLALTAVLMLGTIESAFNGIFRVTRPRALVPRLLVFWALITLGPLMVGASFSLSTYFFALTEWAGVDPSAGPTAWLTAVGPTVLFMVALALFYAVIPNRPVGVMAALAGGITGGLLFAVVRQGFALYVSNFPTYQTIYGAVSAVPIFLVWMYLSWTVVLLGAVMTAALGDWRKAGGALAAGAPTPGARLVAAVQVLAVLFDAGRDGGGVPRARLLEETGGSERALDRLLADLQAARFTAQTADEDWVLSRDPETVTLGDLLTALGLGLDTDGLVVGGDGWKGRLADCLTDLSRAQHDTTGVTLRALLAEPEGDQVQAAPTPGPGLRPVS